MYDIDTFVVQFRVCLLVDWILGSHEYFICISWFSSGRPMSILAMKSGFCCNSVLVFKLSSLWPGGASRTGSVDYPTLGRCLPRIPVYCFKNGLSNENHGVHERKSTTSCVNLYPRRPDSSFFFCPLRYAAF